MVQNGSKYGGRTHSVEPPFQMYLTILSPQCILFVKTSPTCQHHIAGTCMQIGQILVILGCKQMQVTHIVIVQNCCKCCKLLSQTSCCQCCSLLLYWINIAVTHANWPNPSTQADASETYCCYWELAADFTNSQPPEHQHICVCLCECFLFN